MTNLLNHYCKECELSYSFMLERLPTTKAELKFCEENDAEELIVESSNELEDRVASWKYSDDSYEWTDIPSNKEELEEYEFCNKCKRFIKGKWFNWKK